MELLLGLTFSRVQGLGFFFWCSVSQVGAILNPTPYILDYLGFHARLEVLAVTLSLDLKLRI